MPGAIGSVGGFGIAFIISYTMCGEIMAKDVSSPQTTELNAKTRAPTLMKYVHIGQVESAGIIALAAMWDKAYRKPILLGGVLGIAVNEALYLHAKNQGIKNPGPATEQHDNEKLTVDTYSGGGFTYG